MIFQIADFRRLPNAQSHHFLVRRFECREDKPSSPHCQRNAPQTNSRPDPVVGVLTTRLKLRRRHPQLRVDGARHVPSGRRREGKRRRKRRQRREKLFGCLCRRCRPPLTSLHDGNEGRWVERKRQRRNGKVGKSKRRKAFINRLRHPRLKEINRRGRKSGWRERRRRKVVAFFRQGDEMGE